MRFVCCAITVVVAAACAKGSRSAAPASAATDGTASAASAGNVGTPAVPESASAPAVDTSARQSHLSRAPMSHAPARTAPAIARVAGPSGMLGSKRARDTTPRDTGAAASHGASTPAGGSASDSVKVNEFMSYDKAKKTVTIDIFEAYNSNLGGFNVNGGYSGNDTITVPE